MLNNGQSNQERQVNEIKIKFIEIMSDNKVLTKSLVFTLYQKINSREASVLSSSRINP